MSDIPTWAIDRAMTLCGFGYDSSRKLVAVRAFARYIAEHEESPIDPLLIEAREIAAEYAPHDCKDYRSGKHDEHSSTKAILAALRRGIELARKGSGDG